mgnify:CR=1 FL=1
MQDKNQDKSREKMNKGKRKRKSKLGTFLLLIFLLLYVPSLFNWVYGRSINTAVIRMGMLEESVNTDGYIIRNEETLKSQFEGKYIPEVAEGDKVPANFRVATVLRKTSVELLDALKELDMKIIDEQNKKSENGEFFSEDIAKLDEKIEEKVRLIINQSNMNSLSAVGTVKDEIDELIKKKASVMGGLNTSDAYINQLIKEKRRIQEQINSNTKDIISESPGIISFTVDGYEEVLSPKAIEELTPDILEKIKPADADGGVRDNDVQVGRPFAKIIKGNEYYVVAALDAKEAESFNQNDVIDLRISDIGKVIRRCQVTYKSEKKEGKQIIAVKADKYLNETAGLRKVNVDLIKSSHEGLKVPLKSLKDVDFKEMKAKIVLIKANCASIRPVKILGRNDEFAIISSLDGEYEDSVSLYDSYAVNPNNIEEGQIIDQ